MRKQIEARTRAKSMRRAVTRAETILWTRLKGRQLNGFLFRRQHPIGPYIADFACQARMLVVEVDGATHASAEERVHDERRRKFIESEGWVIVRFWNREVYDNEDGVLATILGYLPDAGPEG